MDPNLANVTQALLYALATRLGAPGRPWYMLVTVLVIGLAGGWLTGITGGIGAAFLGHAITRIAIFLTTGHAGIPKAPRAPRTRRSSGGGGRPTAGQVLGHAATRGTADESRPGAPAAARPPVALYVHVPFCVSLCPYCDFVVYAGAAARGPGGPRRAPSPTRCSRRSRCAPTRPMRRSGRGRGTEPLRTVYLGGGTPTLLPSASIAAILGLVRSRFGIADGAEVTIEANPGPDERGDAAGAGGGGREPASRWGRRRSTPALLRRLGRRHRPADVADAVREARAAGIGSVSVDLLYDVPGQAVEATGRRRWTRRWRWAWTTSRRTRSPSTTPTRRASRARRATTCRRPPAPGAGGQARVADQDEDRAAAQYRLAVERLAAAGFRGYEISQLGPARATRAATTSRTGGATRTRRWARGARVRRGDAALERGAAGRLPRRAGAGRWVRPGPATGRRGGGRPAGRGGRERDPGPAAGRGAAGGRGACRAALPAPGVGGGVGILERVAGPDGPRLRLTIEGRLLSNELFSRLV